MDRQIIGHIGSKKIMREIKNMLEVYFIAGTQNVKGRELLSVLEEALQSGITCFQFREKGEGSLVNNPSLLYEQARFCQELCHQYGVPFIVNDYVDLAIELKADGVHVGQKDQSIEDTIKRVGKQMIVGYSTNNLKQFLEAEKISGIDYVGIGPAFRTLSKKDHEPVIGPAGIQQAMERRLRLPAVAIGGINEKNVHQVWNTGVDGVSVISAITESDDIKKNVEVLKTR